MKTYIALTTTLLTLLMVFTVSTSFASEVTGTFTSQGKMISTTTATTTSVAGTVISSDNGSNSNNNGSIVVPALSYSLAGSGGSYNFNSNSNAPQVLGASTYRASAPVYYGMGGEDTSDLAQASGGDNSGETNVNSTTTSTTTTVTTPANDQPVVTTVDTSGQSAGMFDFLGISMWFWLVLLILIIIIIGVMYMQSL